MSEGEKISPSVVNMLLKSVFPNPVTVTLSPPPAYTSFSSSPASSKASTTVSVSSLSKVLPPTSAKSLPPTPAKPTLPAIAFGKEKWTTYIGDIGVEPPLPSNIHEILKKAPT